MISIKNLNFGYKRKQVLFDGLSLELAQGGIYGLLGKNGAGKTTLMKIIAGLRFPGSGDVEVMNFLPRQRHSEFLQELFFLPEEFYIPPITARKYAELYAPFYPKFSLDQYKKYLSEFNIPYIENMTTLSMGQRKKCLIAFGLALNTRLLLLDEPTNGLDIPSKSQFRKIVASTLTDEKIIVISTHQVQDVENLIDPVLILDTGKIIFNYDIQTIARILLFDVNTDKPKGEDILFTEKCLQGYLYITKNRTGTESKIELEPLFNMIMANREKVTTIFAAGVCDVP